MDMSLHSDPSPNSERWEIVAGPEQMIPWENPDVSSAWVWTLRHRRTGEIRELVVRVTWKGFDSIDEVPSRVTREAYASAGRSGVTEFMDYNYDSMAELIYHSQSRDGPHGSSGRYDIIRLPRSP
jgi:hypothetical protein